MSRYTGTLPSGRTIAWGYDRPLHEYFLSEYWSKKESDANEAYNQDMYESFGSNISEWPDDVEVKGEVVFSIMSHTTTDPHPSFPDKMDYSNGEFLELMTKNYPEGIIPPEHIEALILDLPF